MAVGWKATQHLAISNFRSIYKVSSKNMTYSLPVFRGPGTSSGVTRYLLPSFLDQRLVSLRLRQERSSTHLDPSEKVSTPKPLKSPFSK